MSQARRTVVRASSSVTALNRPPIDALAETEPRDREPGPTERDARDGIEGHCTLLMVDADDDRIVSSSPPSTGQNTEHLEPSCA